MRSHAERHTADNMTHHTSHITHHTSQIPSRTYRQSSCSHKSAHVLWLAVVKTLQEMQSLLTGLHHLVLAPARDKHDVSN